MAKIRKVDCKAKEKTFLFIVKKAPDCIFIAMKNKMR